MSDICGVNTQIKLNRVQYEAAKLVTGATCMHGTSSNALLADFGWESSQTSQERHKLLLFYKLLNECPQHLEEIQHEFIVTPYAS